MNVVSLFSGAGGLDLGFTQAGHHVLWANDIFPDAVETYRNNIGNHIIYGDIKEIPSSEIPDCDIIIGGFPCQGFSVANTGRREDDERNKLYQEMIRIIHDKRPRFFLAENVKGILSLAKGAVFQRILTDFRELGYNVKYKLLNAADYGVPQKRLRVIIVGVRNDQNLEYHFPQPTHSEKNSINTQRWISVTDAIGNLPSPDEPNNLPNHIYSKYKLNFNGYIGHRPINPDAPAPTVTARGDDRGGVVILPHPNGQRRMTCHELATIQSFPANYTFTGGISSVCRQIGNAVPPMLARAVANQFNYLTPIAQ
ncbi:MAG: DNA cytosine methyltransferase [Bacteroidaceae bacterium]|nr:DNA cytosine methyltransferase [Bacteroidaceae bacterium]